MTNDEFRQVIAERLYERLYDRLSTRKVLLQLCDPFAIAQMARDIALNTPLPDPEPED